MCEFIYFIYVHVCVKKKFCDVTVTQTLVVIALVETRAPLTNMSPSSI